MAVANVRGVDRGMEQTEKISLRAWLVIFSASLYFFYEFMQVNMFNALDPALIQVFHVSAARLGALSAYYFYGVIPLLLPAGIILDRISTRQVIIVGMIFSITGTLVFALSTSFWLTEACRFATGLAGAFCLLSNIRLASRWFPARSMALVMGFVVTMGMVGGMVAQTPLTILMNLYGWRHALLIDAGFGVLCLVMIILVVRDYPPGYDHDYEQQTHALHDYGFWHSLGLVVRNTQNWLAGLYTSLINLPIFLLGAIWGGMYLTQARHLTTLQASYVTSMIFVGTIIGSPVIGWISDVLCQRRKPMIICAIISLALILALMYMPHLSLPGLMLLFFGVGFFTSAQIISYALIAECNTHALTGTAEGLAAVIIMTGGLSQPFFGWLMDLHWDHTFLHQIPFYSSFDYRLGLSIIPIAFVFGLLAALLIKETHCKAID